MHAETEKDIEEQIAALISQIQRIHRAVAATGQPASQLELFELQRLGHQYGVLAGRLRALQQERRARGRELRHGDAS